MSTSGTTALTLTARDFVTKAMQETKILAIRDQAEGTELEAGLLSLNGMLKSLQSQGVLWGETSGTAVIAAGQASVTLPVEVRTVISARFQGANGYEREMGSITRADYRSYPNKTTTGTPTVFYVDRQRDAAVLYVWPVSATDTTLTIDYLRGFDMSPDGSDLVDVPEEWAEAVWTNLALRLATNFGAEISPELVSRASSLMTTMLDDSRPDSYFMGAYSCG